MSDNFLIGGFGQPAQNVDATGRTIRHGPPDCRREKQAIKKIDREMEDIKFHLQNSKNKLDRLLRKKDRLNDEISRSFVGLGITAHISSIPVFRLDELSEFIKRYFDVQIQSKLQKHLDELGSKLSKVRKELVYQEDQMKILCAQKTRIRRLKEEAERDLATCMN